MRGLEPLFELNYGNQDLTISEHEISGKRIFRINFGPSIKPLVITVGLNSRNQKFWTSIPQGRQKEASEIGKLIAEYIRAKKRLRLIF